MAKVNLTLGTKGGIGKSFVASTIAQYLAEKPLPGNLWLYDIDPNCHTLSRQTALNATFLDLMTNGEIEKRKFDVLFQNILAADANDLIVIDSGSNAYNALLMYLVNNGILELLVEEKHQVFLHLPISGGAELQTTIEGFSEVAKATPDAVMLIPWLNNFHGSLEYKGTHFEQAPGYKALSKAGRIPAIVKIPPWADDMKVDVAEMFKIGRTFNEAITGDFYNVIVRQRLKMAKRKLFGALETAGVF